MINLKKSISRRTLLRGAGAAVALPLLDAMVPAFAGPTDIAAKPVLRMGFVYVPNGILMRYWTPTIEGPNWEATRLLEPLTPFRDKALVLSGLDNLTSMALPGEGGAHHTRASATFLTGVHPKATDGIDVPAFRSIRSRRRRSGNRRNWRRSNWLSILFSGRASASPRLPAPT